jgi:hypothetical protein
MDFLERGSAGKPMKRLSAGHHIGDSALERQYMDAHTLPSFQVMRACRIRLHQYIRTLAAAEAAVPDGFGWLAPYSFHALEVLLPFWVLPTTVQPVLPSLRDRLSNRWCVLLFCRRCQ